METNILMLEKVRRTIEKYNMATEEYSSMSVLCCLSGGADSTALLLCLSELGFNVKACHVNHNLRGEESKRDENFCRSLCERLDIPLDVRSIDVMSYCRKHSLSVEEGAREMRYEIFSQSHCDRIATAHTLSDNLETTIFRLARGTGLEGLVGIPPVRERIIRPLIECTRDEIEAYLKQRGQGFVTDSTNLKDEYSRNKIRLCVVPELKKLNPSLEKTYSGTVCNLSEDAYYLNKMADKLYNEAKMTDGFDSKLLGEADNALSGRVFRRILSEHHVNYSRDAVLRLKGIALNGGKITVAQGLYAVCENGLLRFSDCQAAQSVRLMAEVGKQYFVFGKTVELSIVKDSYKFVNVHKNLTNFIADYGKIKGVIFLHNRQGNERIQLCGRNFSSSVKKLLQERFPKEKRSEAIMLEDSEGLIFVEGFGFAQRAAPDKFTKTFLFCKIS